MIVSGFRAPSATRLASVISPLVPTMEPTTPDGLLFHRTPNMLNLSVIERRTAHEEMVRHRCRGSRRCCSEGSYGCGSSQRLGSLPVLSSLTGRPALRCGVARVFFYRWISCGAVPNLIVVVWAVPPHMRPVSHRFAPGVIQVRSN